MRTARRNGARESRAWGRDSKARVLRSRDRRHFRQSTRSSRASLPPQITISGCARRVREGRDSARLAHPPSPAGTAVPLGWLLCLTGPCGSQFVLWAPVALRADADQGSVVTVVAPSRGVARPVSWLALKGSSRSTCRGFPRPTMQTMHRPPGLDAAVPQHPARRGPAQRDRRGLSAVQPTATSPKQ